LNSGGAKNKNKKFIDINKSKADKENKERQESIKRLIEQANKLKW
jgi:hypothetical protein